MKRQGRPRRPFGHGAPLRGRRPRATRPFDAGGEGAGTGLGKPDFHPDDRGAVSPCFARDKPRLPIIGLAYRALRLARGLVGRMRLFRFCLDASWLLHRFALELSGELFDISVRNSTWALSDDILRRWIPPAGSVIDIGCGTGRWCRAAARYAGEVVGVDASASSIETARQMTREANISYAVGDALRSTYNQRFDVALLVHVLEHIDDADALLESMHDLAPVLIVEVPDFDSNCLNYFRRDLGRPYYSDADHVREYTLEALRRQLLGNGWIVSDFRQRGGAIVVVAKSAGGATNRNSEARGESARGEPQRATN